MNPSSQNSFMGAPDPNWHRKYMNDTYSTHHDGPLVASGSSNNSQTQPRVSSRNTETGFQQFGRNQQLHQSQHTPQRENATIAAELQLSPPPAASHRQYVSVKDVEITPHPAPFRSSLEGSRMASHCGSEHSRELLSQHQSPYPQTGPFRVYRETIGHQTSHPMSDSRVGTQSHSIQLPRQPQNLRSAQLYDNSAYQDLPQYSPQLPPIPESAIYENRPQFEYNLSVSASQTQQVLEAVPQYHNDPSADRDLVTPGNQFQPQLDLSRPQPARSLIRPQQTVGNRVQPHLGRFYPHPVQSSNNPYQTFTNVNNSTASNGNPHTGNETGDSSGLRHWCEMTKEEAKVVLAHEYNDVFFYHNLPDAKKLILITADQEHDLDVFREQGLEELKFSRQQRSISRQVAARPTHYAEHISQILSCKEIGSSKEMENEDPDATDDEDMGKGGEGEE